MANPDIVTLFNSTHKTDIADLERIVRNNIDTQVGFMSPDTLKKSTIEDSTEQAAKKFLLEMPEVDFGDADFRVEKEEERSLKGTKKFTRISSITPFKGNEKVFFLKPAFAQSNNAIRGFVAFKKLTIVMDYEEVNTQGYLEDFEVRFKKTEEMLASLVPEVETFNALVRSIARESIENRISEIEYADRAQRELRDKFKKEK